MYAHGITVREIRGHLDDFPRYVIAWRLCTGMTASDVS
jgi:hypothetical protein